MPSGMLTGEMSAGSTFAADDHRSFDWPGEALDVGETFSGVPYDVAPAAVERLRDLVPGGAAMAQFALRWILKDQAVSVAIPGATGCPQAEANAAAGGLPPLTGDALDRARAVYRERIAPPVHRKW